MSRLNRLSQWSGLALAHLVHLRLWGPAPPRRETDGRGDCPRGEGRGGGTGQVIHAPGRRNVQPGHDTRVPDYRTIGKTQSRAAPRPCPPSTWAAAGSVSWPIGPLGPPPLLPVCPSRLFRLSRLAHRRHHARKFAAAMAVASGGGERRSVGRSVLSRRRHVPDFEVRRAARDCTLSLLFGGTAEQRRSARRRDAATRAVWRGGGGACLPPPRRARWAQDGGTGRRGRTTGRGPRRMRTSTAASLFPSLSKFR